MSGRVRYHPPVPELENRVWTDADFEGMGWHDASLHGIAFVEGDEPWLGTLLLDIDYIVEWVQPEPPSRSFSFHVAPATLAFEEAIDIRMELAAASVTFGVALQILRVHRTPPKAEALARTHFDYRIEGSGFDLRLTAARYRQHFRAAPIVSGRQTLSVAQRGLPSFGQGIAG